HPVRRIVLSTMKIWFRCGHKKTTFPITRPRKVKDAFRVADTYIVCLDCGYEMPYSWNEMRVYKERRKASRAVPLGAEESQPALPIAAR
ncbi:MAG TPA: hypothetical protein VNN17_09610, partial [Terriglobia bacterium]|nr:hypothetical protein [Terriglobia bacterium]